MKVGEVWVNMTNIIMSKDGESCLMLVVRDDPELDERFTLLDLERGHVSHCSELTFSYPLWRRMLP